MDDKISTMQSSIRLKLGKMKVAGFVLNLNFLIFFGGWGGWTFPFLEKCWKSSEMSEMLKS